jgi:uncharacterized protein YndB with AHSA1/START domain
MTTDRTRAPLIFQVRVNAPPATVFDAFFGHPERWFCRTARVDAKVGGELELCWPDGCWRGRFVQCEPPHVARFSWQLAGEPLPATMVVVRADPTADGAGAQVEVEHYGFGAGADWDLVYLGAVRAWASYLKNLRAVLEAGIDLREADE